MTAPTDLQQFMDIFNHVHDAGKEVIDGMGSQKELADVTAGEIAFSQFIKTDEIDAVLNTFTHKLTFTRGTTRHLEDLHNRFFQVQRTAAHRATTLVS